MRRFGRKKGQGQVRTRHSDKFRVSRAEQRRQEAGTLKEQELGKPRRFPGRRKKRYGCWDSLVGRERKEEAWMAAGRGHVRKASLSSENANQRRRTAPARGTQSGAQVTLRPRGRNPQGPGLVPALSSVSSEASAASCTQNEPWPLPPFCI